jgi:hypothetical protein
MDRDPLEAAINEADRLGIANPEQLVPALDRMPPHPGVGKLRATLARYTRTDSNLERRFLAIVRKARLPMPATQEHLGRGRIDFQDRRRDQAHTAAGRTQIRFANLQIREDPGEVADVLRAVIKRAATGTRPRR